MAEQAFRAVCTEIELTFCKNGKQRAAEIEVAAAGSLTIPQVHKRHDWILITKNET